MINKSGTIVSDDGIKLGFDESDDRIGWNKLPTTKEFDKYIDKNSNLKFNITWWK
jgi:hypothetical protein